jgi:hypothetical protein
MLECLSIRLVGRIIHHSVAFIVETRGRLRHLRKNWGKK